jgi:hypothetical protein
MLDETKRLIETEGFTQASSTIKYRTWYIPGKNIAISEDIKTLIVEFNFDYYATTQSDDNYWISEDEGLRRFRLTAFW